MRLFLGVLIFVLTTSVCFAGNLLIKATANPEVRVQPERLTQPSNLRRIEEQSTEAVYDQRLSFEASEKLNRGVVFLYAEVQPPVSKSKKIRSDNFGASMPNSSQRIVSMGFSHKENMGSISTGSPEDILLETVEIPLPQEPRGNYGNSVTSEASDIHVDARFSGIIVASADNASDSLFTNSFDSKGHPKARGLWLSVKYPSGWAASEGERPHIVQRFQNLTSRSTIVLQLQILDSEAGQKLEEVCREASGQEWDEAASDSRSGAKVTGSRKIQIGGKPAFLSDVFGSFQRSGVKGVVLARQMSVCYKDKLVYLWCGTAAEISDEMSARRRLSDAEGLCRLYFNSLVLLD